MPLEFSGKAKMLDMIDAAVEAEDAARITENLRAVLPRIVADEAIRLPECVFRCETDHYCRRLIHQDDRAGYSVLAMTWGPGQGTPLHDHNGMWCVEAVWHGEIEVVQYELTEREDNQFRLEPRTTMRTGVGSAGSLIPPHEYHTITNPSEREPAITLHVYSGVMDECCVFKPIGDHWFRRRPTELGLDSG
jgi:predicted metal-dependent enzyme (double-stranded beta helix superfamily)